ncbi:PLP-dependent aminotransferase family protein [Nocardia amamiensis]|uniref:PLP-dependent aminotransferase family protein n=1 Tax=Nocardia amamiensis TaxID=404578 RepID=A0ABS0CLJ0_9NOCA|nr:PLP-dependent aminotransferase family protein [Nocardia amamiensis]MBF6296658.1 PLP-dependent aminotransferase family protein [Nocardia amamiensis]
MALVKRSSGAAAVASGPIDDIFAALAKRPDVVSFAVGAPDPALLPGELVSALSRDVIGKYGSAVLQYGMTQGFGPLLDEARNLLRTRGIRCSPDSLHISTGGSGALHNVCLALLDPQDVVLVETPTYGPAVKEFRSHGATVVGVPSDDFGIVPEALEEALARYDAAFVYLLPTFQNPTGRTMPTPRREQIAQIVVGHDTLVIEDDVYADLRYRGVAPPALVSFAPDNSVYITSLSKTLAPALRVGITVMPPDLLRSVLALKQGIDMQTSTYCQAIAAEFLGSAAGAAHLARLVEVYSAKLDTLADAVERHFPPGFQWVAPDGGMFLWVEGPQGFDADALLGTALREGVAFLPGSAFYADDADHRNTMRLSFANVPGDDIDRGIAVLAALCEEAT